MPLKMQTQVNAITPNAVFIPLVMITSRIVNGQIRTSCQITLTPASYVDGVWIQTLGRPKTVHIPDIENLDTDIVALQAQVLTVMGGIISLVDAVNAIRKII